MMWKRSDKCVYQIFDLPNLFPIPIPLEGQLFTDPWDSDRRCSKLLTLIEGAESIPRVIEGDSWKAR